MPGSAPLVVKPYHRAAVGLQVRDDESHAREQLDPPAHPPASPLRQPSAPRKRSGCDRCPARRSAPESVRPARACPELQERSSRRRTQLQTGGSDAYGERSFEGRPVQQIRRETMWPRRERLDAKGPALAHCSRMSQDLTRIGNRRRIARMMLSELI